MKGEEMAKERKKSEHKNKNFKTTAQVWWHGQKWGIDVMSSENTLFHKKQ